MTRHRRLEAGYKQRIFTHGQAYHKTSSTKLLVDRESGYVHAYVKAEGHQFEHATNSLPRKTRYVCVISVAAI